MYRSIEPFVFYSRLHLVELTGIRAATVPELLEHIRTASGSSIYHHTHHFVQQHQYLSPEPPNDFAYWVSNVLGDDRMGEQLASIDIMAYPSIRAIREALVTTIENGLKKNPRLKSLAAAEAEEFNFLKSVSFVFSTEHRAANLPEFADCLRQTSISSIYYHMFEARLRLERPTNDFSRWLADVLDEKQLALKIAKLDPYSLTGESLRSAILSLVDKKVATLRGV